MPYRQVTTRGKQVCIEIDKRWPLPVPDYLVPLFRLDASHQQAGPHYDVLLQMALAAKRPDEVLHWYDKRQAGSKRAGTGRSRYAGGHLSDEVAAAVAATHAERAVAIYRASLQACLPHADPASYAAAAGYLHKLRPVFKSLGREDDTIVPYCGAVQLDMGRW